jgi:hypothetical protein
MLLAPFISFLNHRAHKKQLQLPFDTLKDVILLLIKHLNCNMNALVFILCLNDHIGEGGKPPMVGKHKLIIEIDNNLRNKMFHVLNIFPIVFCFMFIIIGECKNSRTSYIKINPIGN